MPVDKVELAKDLESAEYQTLVKETLGKKDFTIRTKDEQATYEQNFKKDVIEKEIPGKIKEVHDQYDKDVSEMTGLKREQNEKTYDFVKRALKANTGDSAALTAKIKTLEEQIAKGDTSGATKKLLEEAEAKFKTKLQEQDQLITKLQGETTATKKQSLLTSDYATIKASFVKQLPKLFDRTEKSILTEALEIGLVDDDGKIYASDGKGNFLKDSSFQKIPMTVWLKNEFKDVIDAGAKPLPGGGSQPPNKTETNPDLITVDNFVVPETIKTGTDLGTYMLEQGLMRGTQKYTDIWNKFRYDLPDGKGMKRPEPPKPAAK
jgi:hypothetical protein